MGKYDRDRFQKELAVRFCLASRMAPFLEVLVPSAADLSDTVETLTDIDVLGINGGADGGVRRVIFDCKTSNRMSSINRAFWASGVATYTRSSEAIVLLKNRAVHNHRISALSINVDLHNEDSFRNLGKTVDEAFPSDNCYQASIDRWNSLYEVYAKNNWSEDLLSLAHNQIPLSHTPSMTFRRVILALRAIRGEFDPRKRDHVAILLDVVASVFVLWIAMSRDIRRFYEPTMDRGNFERILRYYIWGGKEAYSVRQQMRDKVAQNSSSTLDLPNWNLLVNFCGIVVSAPQNMMDCVFICRELSLSLVSGDISCFDLQIERIVSRNSRARQFVSSIFHYLVSAAALPDETNSLALKKLGM